MTSADAGLALAGHAPGARERYAFETSPVLRSPDAFRPAELLQVETLWDRAPETLLVPEANYGVVATVLADAGTAVVATESSARGADAIRRNARENDVEVDVALLANCAPLDEPAAEATADPVDAVAYAPAPYAPVPMGIQRIADTLAALRPGGTCYVAASETAGLNRYERFLGVHAAIETVASRGDVRLLAATPPESFDPSTAVEVRRLTPTVAGVDLDLVSVPGLFAASGLDHGTRLLLETAEIPDGARVLDCCCGYGPIGAYAAAAADCDVVLTDDDRVATRCAELGLDRTGVEATVHTADGAEAVADGSVDLALCNPPTHAGAAVLDRLCRGLHRTLARGGECLLVRHRDLDLSRHLAPFGDRVVIATGADHAVVRASR